MHSPWLLQVEGSHMIPEKHSDYNRRIVTSLSGSKSGDVMPVNNIESQFQHTTDLF